MSNARNLARLLPDSSGKIQLPSQVAGVLPKANAVSGSVLQVVFAQKKDTQSISATAGITPITGLSADITPISSNSRIVVQAYIVMATYNGASAASGILLYRNGSNITNSAADAAASRPQVWLRNDSYAGISSMPNFNGDHGPNILSGFYVDSPSSTSLQNYSVQLRPQTNMGGSFVINRSGSDSNASDMWGARATSGLILMEIAG